MDLVRVAEALPVHLSYSHKAISGGSSLRHGGITNMCVHIYTYMYMYKYRDSIDYRTNSNHIRSNH